jgi:hypothetical protein
VREERELVQVFPGRTSIMRAITPALQCRSQSLLSASPSVANHCNPFFHLSRFYILNPLEQAKLPYLVAETGEAQTLIAPVVMRIHSDGVVLHGGALHNDPDHDRHEDDTDDTPVTPLDELRLPRIQDP